MDARGHDVGLRRAVGLAPVSLRDVGLRRFSRMAVGAWRGVLARLGLLELHVRVGGLVSDRVLLHVLPPRARGRRWPEPPIYPHLRGHVAVGQIDPRGWHYVAAPPRRSRTRFAASRSPGAAPRRRP